MDGLLLFIGLVTLVFLAGAALSRRSLTRLPDRSIAGTSNTTSVSVIDSVQLSQAVTSLLGPGSMEAKVLKMLDPNSPAWAQFAATHKGSDLAADSPFRIVMQVRAALVAQQLESVRNLLSDRLYQRLSASPPAPQPAAVDRVAMVATKHSGDDPNRTVVRVGGSLVVPGAGAEDWTLLRTSGATTGAIALPAPTTAAAPPLPLTACPYCGAQLDAGATRCKFCGMDATMAAEAPQTPTAASAPPAAAGWIVDDVMAANPMAA